MNKRCPVCQGSKKMQGMGHILKDCTRCDALGFIDDVIEISQKDMLPAIPRKKPGRKSRFSGDELNV